MDALSFFVGAITTLFIIFGAEPFAKWLKKTANKLKELREK